MLQMKLSFKAVEGHDKYLGLPTYIGGSKKQVFQSIQDRVWKKLKGWKENYLSQAGKEVLIKSVAQAIPTYAMQCFEIPVSILDEIEKLYRNFFWGQKGEERKLCWIAWEKLFLSKNEGGLGFRDMRKFNKALLAKQAWRIIRYPESLVARVLKAKYFPTSNLMEATINPNASFTWRSILKAREVLMHGVRKSIGNGANVRIWQDPWVPILPGFRIASHAPTEGQMPWYVRDLWIGKSWNIPLLHNLLSPMEVDAICSVPIPISERPDSWVWHHSKDGNFSVRSAYHQLMMTSHHSTATTSVSHAAFDWKDWWRIPAIPKVKLLSWRALREGVAARQNLIQRGMKVDPICPVCGLEEESVLHMLVKCSEAKKIWYLSPLRVEVTNYEGSSFKDWCIEVKKSHKEKEWWSLALNLIWGIWLRRNSWMYEGLKIPIQKVIHKAVSLLGEVEKAQQTDVHGTPSTEWDCHWKKPENGVIKVNSDAAIFQSGGAGLGVVMRDYVGDVVVSSCLPVQGAYQADVAEALAMRHAITTALDAGFFRLCLETDCMKLYSALKKKKMTEDAFGSLVHDILQLSHSSSFCSFSFVKRSGNNVAHALAQLCSSYDSLRVWMEEVPSNISCLVEADLATLSN